MSSLLECINVFITVSNLRTLSVLELKFPMDYRLHPEDEETENIRIIL